MPDYSKKVLAILAGCFLLIGPHFIGEYWLNILTTLCINSILIMGFSLIASLGRMSFAILKTFLNRQKRSGLIDLKHDLFDEMIQYNLVENEYQPDILRIKGLERPPMVEIPEYRKKFDITN